MQIGRFKAKDTPYSINQAIDRANGLAPLYCGERQDIVIFDNKTKGAIMSRGAYYDKTINQVIWGHWEEY